jgi:Mannitol-1-phosphate/altronate dehydrogenases
MNSQSLSLYPKDKSVIDSLCIGSGRFLRAVLVPALVAANLKPAIVQTRGTSFMKYCSSRKSGEDQWTYEVDTVLHDGEIKTDVIVCYGAGTLGTEEGKKDTLELLDGLKGIKLIGVGVTEAGLASATTKSMRDLFDILSRLQELMSVGTIACNNPSGKISIVNTDNVPHNGDVIRSHMMKLAHESEKEEKMTDFLKEHVVFHNSMVDRITSQRPGSDGLVPRAEPTPAKALVIEDLEGDLPLDLLKKDIQDTHGVIVRLKQGELDADIALKLRVANGTHTAVAHTMALCGLLMTDVLSSPKNSTHYDSASLLMAYLDALFEHQICIGVEVTEAFCATALDAKYVYQDWRQRLAHGHFGLSTFFITQNGAAKGGIRLGPTVIDLVNHDRVRLRLLFLHLHCDIRDS